MAGVTERRVPAKGSKKRLLEGVLRIGAAQKADEVAEHLVPVLLVKPLERRQSHGVHHAVKRSGSPRCETARVRIGVVGHVEWVEFLRVPQVPKPGDIVQSTERWEEPAGGGGVAAGVLRSLAGEATLFTVLGDDELGHRAKDALEALGIRVEAVFRKEPQRRAIVFVDEDHERTITLIGHKLRPRIDEALPWSDLADFQALYFTAGHPEVVQAARQAKVLVATAREIEYLKTAHVRLDALVLSDSDPAEEYTGDLHPEPDLVVRTRGSEGGSYYPGGGEWDSVEIPAPAVDSYGAGDSFAAGLTYGLGKGLPIDDALAVAARCGAEALARRGAHGA
jgi:ribokinase